MLVIIAVLLLFFFVKEKQAINREDSARRAGLHSLKVIFAEKDKALSLSCSPSDLVYRVSRESSPLRSLSKDYPADYSGTASLLRMSASLCIFAILSGIIAHRSQKRTIRTSLLMLVGILTSSSSMIAYLNDGTAFRQYTFWALLFLFGIFWVSVVTNSFPMLWQMSTYKTVGIYTGLYYFFSQLASIISPPITGAFIDLFGFRAIFLYGAGSMLIAFFLMKHVNRGEPEDDPIAKAVEA